MCCGSDTTTTRTQIPPYLEEAAKATIGDVRSFYQSPYKHYPGPRQADFSSDQTSAFKMLRDYVGGGGTSGLANEGTNMVRQASTAPVAQVSTERIIDEGGRLGQLADYLNPFVSNVVQPQIRELEESGQRERNRIGGLAQTAGAFGDARHGILEGELGSRLRENIADTAGRGYYDAWNTALGMRTGDLNRFLQADTGNAGLYEQALSRAMAGGDRLTGQATTQQNDLLSRLSALLSTGTTQQQQAQTALDIPYTDFEAAKQDEYDRLAALVSVIGGVPYARQQTTETPSSGIFGALGSLLGGVF